MIGKPYSQLATEALGLTKMLLQHLDGTPMKLEILRDKVNDLVSTGQDQSNVIVAESVLAKAVEQMNALRYDLTAIAAILTTVEARQIQREHQQALNKFPEPDDDIPF